jgi:hypothetical protein
MARPRPAQALLVWVALPIALGCARSAAVPIPAEPASRLAGDVREISLEEGRIVIADVGRLRVVAVTADTIIRRGRAESSLAELRRGDRVVVSMAAEPPPTARLIAIAGSAPGAPRPLGVPLP